VVPAPNRTEIRTSRSRSAGTDNLSEPASAAAGGSPSRGGAVYEKERNSKELKRKKRRPTERRLLFHPKECLGYSGSGLAYGL
jgi:hypothetical protein